MKKSTRRLLRFGLPLALFGGCLLFSYHMNVLPGLLEPGMNSHHNDDGVQLSEMYVNDAAHKHTKQDSAANRTHEVGNKSKLLNRRNQTAVLGDTDVCRGVEPWFKKRSSWKQIQLIFYGKPIMQVVKRLCVQRHWKMMIMLNESDPSSLYELQKRVNEEGTFTIMFTSSRLYHLAIVQRLANSTHALVSSIRYAFKTTGPKKEQLNVFRNHFLSYGCMLEEVGIMPRSFLLDDSYDCIQFFKYAHLNPTSWWVLKKSHGYGGEGISIHQNSSKLYTKFGLCKGNREYVVQEYIYNLLLVEKRKFDVRGLVLIAGTNPYFLFYHEGYLRVSVSDFSYNSNRNVHITNSHLQVMSRDFDPEKHFWSFERFQSFLDAHHPENNHFVENKLIPFIKNTSLFLLQSSKQREFLYFIMYTAVLYACECTHACCMVYVCY